MSLNAPLKFLTAIGNQGISKLGSPPKAWPLSCRQPEGSCGAHHEGHQGFGEPVSAGRAPQPGLPDDPPDGPGGQLAGHAGPTHAPQPAHIHFSESPFSKCHLLGRAPAPAEPPVRAQPQSGAAVPCPGHRRRGGSGRAPAPGVAMGTRPGPARPGERPVCQCECTRGAQTASAQHGWGTVPAKHTRLPIVQRGGCRGTGM